MFTYERTRFETFLPELKRLAPDHYAFNGDHTYPLDPNWDVYLEGERRGKALLWAVRDNDRPCGYLVGYNTVDVNSQGVPLGIISTYYVESRPARGRILRKLIAKAVADMRRAGIVQIKIETDWKHPASRLLESMDFVPERIGYILKSPAAEEFAGHARTS